MRRRGKKTKKLGPSSFRIAERFMESEQVDASSK